MKKKLLKIILVISLIIFSFILFYYKTISYPFKFKENTKKIVVDNKDSLYGVFDKLENDGAIRSKYFIKFYIKFNNAETNIKPGKYCFSNNISLAEFISNLNNGIYSKNMIKITIPEGYNVDKIADILQKRNVVNKLKFLNVCKNYKINYIDGKEINRKYLVEGYLYPDTYYFCENMDAQEVVKSMVDRFTEVLKDIDKKQKSIDEKNVDKIITIASIVENEAELDSERDEVASVFYNRINKNMKLESCATVQYALGQHKEKLYYKDLKVKSPYNTYITKGLPPGPICSPGRKSIEAVLKPAKTEYLYFVSKNDKTHFFTKDYKEFLKVKSQTQGN